MFLRTIFPCRFICIRNTLFGVFCFYFSATVFAENTQIDVMVLYTKESAQNLQNYGVAKSVETEIAEAVAYLNQAFTNSSVNITANLVYTASVDFQPSGNDGESLEWLMKPTDGVIDGIHDLRDLHGADIVVLIAQGGSVSGIGGFSQGNHTKWESEAFCIIFVGNDMSETDDRSFAHETGHILGGMHDWYVGPRLGLFYGGETNPGIMHNKGYVFIDTIAKTGFMTIMAYATMASDMNAVCQKIPYFSNPGITYNGKAIGKPAIDPVGDMDAMCYSSNTDIINCNCPADIAGVFNWMANTVAHYRSTNGPDGKVASLNTALSDIHGITLSWSQNISNESGFRIYRSIDEGMNFRLIDSVGTDKELYSDTIDDVVTMNKNWIYRVQAINTHGSSTYDEAVMAIDLVADSFDLTENFEGGFAQGIPWVNESNYPWHIVTRRDANGSALKADDNLSFMGWQPGETSPNFEVTLEFKTGFILFDISTNALVQFSIDSTYLKHSAWSLTDSWETVALPITAGQHTLRWEFMGGGDAYIDNIRLPIGDAVAMKRTPRKLQKSIEFDITAPTMAHTVTINYVIPPRYNEKPYSVSIFDLKGRLIQHVRSGVVPDQGISELIEWNTLKVSGKRISTGVYFCILHVGENLYTRQLPFFK